MDERSKQIAALIREEITQSELDRERLQGSIGTPTDAFFQGRISGFRIVLARIGDPDPDR